MNTVVNSYYHNISNFLGNHPDLVPKMYTILVDWIEDLCYEGEYRPEIYYKSLAILCRFLKISKDVKRTELQAYGIIAVQSAQIYLDRCHFYMDDLVYYCDDTYTYTQMETFYKKFHISMKLDENVPSWFEFIDDCSNIKSILRYATQDAELVSKYSIRRLGSVLNDYSKNRIVDSECLKAVFSSVLAMYKNGQEIVAKRPVETDKYPVESFDFPTLPDVSSGTVDVTVSFKKPRFSVKEEEFDLSKPIGQGSYGKVYISKEDPNMVMKIVPGTEAIDFLRELNVFLSAKHENVAELVEYGFWKDNVYMTIPKAIGTLQLYQVYDPATVRCYLFQILSGVNHLHELGLVHRDIKHDNILLYSGNRVRISDFGITRVVSSRNCTGKPINVELSYPGGTLWFRSIELLLGCLKCRPSIDIWAVGCVFYELVTGFPLFPVESEAELIDRIFRFFGTPSAKYLAQFPDSPKILTSFPKRNIQDLPELDVLSENGKDLFAKMFEYDPTKRITAKEAMKHPYFSEDVS